MLDLATPLQSAPSRSRGKAQHRVESGGHGLAMVVTSDHALAETVTHCLSRHGCGVLVVTSAEEAITGFARERPDIIFLALDLPGMGGLAASGHLKRLAGPRFVPIILLAPTQDEEVLAGCLASDADDFILAPADGAALEARVLVMERVCALQSRAFRRKRWLSELLERERREQALAERVLRRAVAERNVVIDRLDLIQRSADIFSGDIVLTQHLPDGGLRVLVGDFTGHGLAAAVAALPVADTFHTMTIKGVSDALVLSELNRKLYQILPADRFMAAVLVTIPPNCEELRWWNGGMPSGWVRTRAGRIELRAHALPLGIVPELPADELPRRTRLTRGDRVLLTTDGLPEARDLAERMFHDRFAELLAECPSHLSLLPRLQEALDQHCHGAEQADDIAVLEIPIEPAIFRGAEQDKGGLPASGWVVTLELMDERLQVQPTLASMLAPIGLAEGLRAHMVTLETILTELFSNALDHGVLGLDSSWKRDADGFDRFYRERSRRLGQSCVGRVGIRVEYQPSGPGGAVRLRVSDSGPGFQEQETLSPDGEPLRLWGRGIHLVRRLCETFELRSGGSEVEVCYRW
jgi:two-component system, HptB-dependent secretion and biofilm response regulator